MFDLQNKVAVVTGGSRGIGRAIALALAAQGARVVVNYRSNAEAAQEVVSQIVGTNGEGAAVAIEADVADPAGAAAVIDAAVKTFGRIDILVNNAGITRDTLIMRMAEADWDAVLDTNLKSAYLVCKAAMRPMLKAKGGRIINIASINGQAGSGGQANYAAAKAGLIGLTKSLAREVASRNITVNAIAPGFIETDMTRGLAEDLKNRAMAQIPLERMGTPDDVAAAAVFLASDEAAYITGHVLNVNGGMYM